MAALDSYLQLTLKSSASDLHLAAGLQPRMRINGKLQPIARAKVMSPPDVANLFRELVSAEQWQTLTRELELDFAYELSGVGRFRGNVFQQERGLAGVFRRIPDQLITAEELALPAAVQGFAHLSRGLVLATGPTGSGKSTTLAALIDLVNEHYDKHIITIEEPIEFIHRAKRCMISQREVGIHCTSFESALRAAMRQNPDVLLVGELRGSEIELAITAAEMGALVFGTLHTNGAAKTIDRLIDGVGREAQEQVRTSLAENLAGIVSQTLVPTADGKGRCAALEILVRTSALPNLIREGNTPQIASMMQSGRGHGMQALDDRLAELVQQGRILAQDAYAAALDKTRFEDLLEPAPEAPEARGEEAARVRLK